MILTNERAETLAKILNETPEILEHPVEEALEFINGKGYDFSVDELKEIDKILVDASNQENRELSGTELENVTGGVYYEALKIIVKWGPKAYRAGYWIGTKIANRYF